VHPSQFGDAPWEYANVDQSVTWTVRGRYGALGNGLREQKMLSEILESHLSGLSPMLRSGFERDPSSEFGMVTPMCGQSLFSTSAEPAVFPRTNPD
jgi:hypothetical protein